MNEKKSFTMLAVLILALHTGATHDAILPCCKASEGWWSYSPDDICSSHHMPPITASPHTLLAEMRLEKGAIIYNTIPLPEGNRREMAEEEAEKQERAWDMLRNTIITPPPLQNPTKPSRSETAPSSPQPGNVHFR